MAIYGLHVRANAGSHPVTSGFPATIRITMAAIDPNDKPQTVGVTAGGPPRATLRILRRPLDMDDDSGSDDDMDSDDLAEYEARFGPGSESDSEDDETNGGPSDPTKRKQALREALQKEMEEHGAADLEDVLMNGVNGTKSFKGKGKAKATEEDDESDEESLDLEGQGGYEEYVLCTLDTTQHYQQPLDITVTDNEIAFFDVVGTHDIYITGNYVASMDNGMDSDSDIDADAFGLHGDEDEMMHMDDYSDDSLDDVDDPRVEEIESQDEAPMLVNGNTGKDAKGKNKRVASTSLEDSKQSQSLDDLMNKALKPADAAAGGEKLSKKQAKKLKNNAGQAVAGGASEGKVAVKEEKDGSKKQEEKPAAKKAEAETDNSKKVKFAKNLEQGPTNGSEKAAAPKASTGIRNVQGVKIDDKKIGSGPAAKKGDKLGMRYIGKLENGTVFDSNKKGAPFSFKLGAAEVIKGWEIGVAGMQVGGERRITVPSDLAYGKKGVPGIPGNSNLIFEVKMLSLK